MAPDPVELRSTEGRSDEQTDHRSYQVVLCAQVRSETGRCGEKVNRSVGFSWCTIIQIRQVSHRKKMSSGDIRAKTLVIKS